MAFVRILLILSSIFPAQVFAARFIQGPETPCNAMLAFNTARIAALDNEAGYYIPDTSYNRAVIAAIEETYRQKPTNNYQHGFALMEAIRKIRNEVPQSELRTFNLDVANLLEIAMLAEIATLQGVTKIQEASTEFGLFQNLWGQLKWTSFYGWLAMIVPAAALVFLNGSANGKNPVVLGIAVGYLISLFSLMALNSKHSPMYPPIYAVVYAARFSHENSKRFAAIFDYLRAAHPNMFVRTEAGKAYSQADYRVRTNNPNALVWDF